MAWPSYYHLCMHLFMYTIHIYGVAAVYLYAILYDAIQILYDHTIYRLSGIIYVRRRYYFY
jgi:hypothetical protein